MTKRQLKILNQAKFKLYIFYPWYYSYHMHFSPYFREVKKLSKLSRAIAKGELI